MVQVQDTRFHYNWIGRNGADYHRYKNVRPAFDSMYAAFQGFLSAEGLSRPTENQWEVTYVNHIRKGTVWREPQDWLRLFVGLPGPWVAPAEVRPESVGAAWHFEIAPRRGRLHIDLKHARLSASSADEILRLTLTARGPVGHGGLSLSEGLDLGRRIIVQAFASITSSEAHRIWERSE